MSFKIKLFYSTCLMLVIIQTTLSLPVNKADSKLGDAKHKGGHNSTKTKNGTQNLDEEEYDKIKWIPIIPSDPTKYNSPAGLSIGFIPVGIDTISPSNPKENGYNTDRESIGLIPVGKDTIEPLNLSDSVPIVFVPDSTDDVPVDDNYKVENNATVFEYGHSVQIKDAALFDYTEQSNYKINNIWKKFLEQKWD